MNWMHFSLFLSPLKKHPCPLHGGFFLVWALPPPLHPQWKFQFWFILSRKLIWAFEVPHTTLEISSTPHWGGYGYFLEQKVNSKYVKSWTYTQGMNFLPNVSPVKETASHIRQRKILLISLKGLHCSKLRNNLRWLITVSSTFQEVDFDGSLSPLFITWCYNHGIKILLNHRWTRWYHFRDNIGYHSNTLTC